MAMISKRDQRRVAAAIMAPVIGGLAAIRFGGLAFAGTVTVALLLLGAVEALDLDAPAGQDKAVEVRRSFWVGLLMPFGLGLLFASERIVGSADEMIWIWRAMPLTCLGAALGWRVFGLSRAKANQKKVERALLAATIGVFASLGLYALGTDAGVASMGFADSAAERVSGVLGVLWPVGLLVSLSATFFMELAYRAMPVEEAIELRRVSASAGTGLSLSLSLVFVISMNYVATERDFTEDLSYLKTTEPSEQTLRMAARLDEPVQVMLFYPQVNEVLDRLRPYFDQLDAASEEITVAVADHALSYEIAQRHRIPRNGFVVILRGEDDSQQAEQFEVGLELESARSRLRSLDARFQQHFAQLTTRPRDLHMTVGHREHSATALDGDTEAERLGQLQASLDRANIQSRNLGVGEGLANDVPESARAVAVIGPREPFMREEAQSLLRYVERGGRLLVFVDPDVSHGLEPLLSGLGVSIPAGVLHSETRHMRRRTGQADLSAVYSNTYSAHPTVTMASRNRSRVVTVFLRGGSIERDESPAQLEGASVTFPLRTEAGFWLDQDGDHSQDPAEPVERFNMIAAVTVPNRDGDEGRAVIIADGDFITDQLIGNRGNAYVVMDSVNWLVGEEHVLAPIQTEEDIPIEHTRDEDKVWFYATSFGMPLPLIVMGAFLSRRRRGGRRPSPKPAPKPSPARSPSPGAAAKEEEEE